nr:6-phosphogluconolactonase [Chloroflexota bacterium]
MTATQLRHGRLVTKILPDRERVGAAAAAHVAGRLATILATRDEARLIFAAAASQGEFLDALVATRGIDWQRVIAFHLDEYVGLAPRDERSFGKWLERRIWSRVRPGWVEKLDGAAAARDPEAECARYGALLSAGGIDLALIGVGENGHLAFNDPHVA